MATDELAPNPVRGNLVIRPSDQERSHRMNPQDIETINRIVDHLGRAQSLFFVTGAGMSADSGLPTYRGVCGLYDVNETEEGLPIEEMLSGEMLAERPEWTWKYPRQASAKCSISYARDST
jgi:NAD-dependent deacetylase